MHFPWYIQSHHNCMSTREQLSPVPLHTPAWLWCTVTHATKIKEFHKPFCHLKITNIPLLNMLVLNHGKKIPCTQVYQPSLLPSFLRPAWKGTQLRNTIWKNIAGFDEYYILTMAMITQYNRKIQRLHATESF